MSWLCRNCGVAPGTGYFCSGLCEKSWWLRIRMGLANGRRRIGPLATAIRLTKHPRSRGRRFPCQVQNCNRSETAFRRCRVCLLEHGGPTAAIILEAA